MTDKEKWLSHPDKDGPYWFQKDGTYQPEPRDVYTTVDGTRYVAKFGDDWDLELNRYSETDRWLPIPIPESSG